MMLDKELTDRIKQKVRANTTPRHVPAKVVQVTDIPRTKSNKIVELAVRNIVHGLPIKNIEALANPEALEQFRDREGAQDMSAAPMSGDERHRHPCRAGSRAMAGVPVARGARALFHPVRACGRSAS
jgi:hypothetical protein